MEGSSKQDVGMGSSSQDLKDIDFKVCTGHSLRDLTSCTPGLGPHLLRFVLRLYVLAHLLSQIVLDSGLDHQKLSESVV